MPSLCDQGKTKDKSSHSVITTTITIPPTLGTEGKEEERGRRGVDDRMLYLWTGN